MLRNKSIKVDNIDCKNINIPKLFAYFYSKSRFCPILIGVSIIFILRISLTSAVPIDCMFSTPSRSFPTRINRTVERFVTVVRISVPLLTRPSLDITRQLINTIVLLFLKSLNSAL